MSNIQAHMYELHPATADVRGVILEVSATDKIHMESRNQGLARVPVQGEETQFALLVNSSNETARRSAAI